MVAGAWVREGWVLFPGRRASVSRGERVLEENGTAV